VAQRVGRGIALLFHDRGTRRGVSGQQHAPATLHPRERPGTHFTVFLIYFIYYHSVMYRINEYKYMYVTAHE
jgi:hypothetical protein